MSCYRAGDNDAALGALGRSMKIRGGGDSFDWYFLAMIHAKGGRKDEARDWYDRAARWAAGPRLLDGELYLFQVEAADALGLPPPQPPQPQPRHRVSPNPR